MRVWILLTLAGLVGTAWTADDGKAVRILDLQRQIDAAPAGGTVSVSSGRWEVRPFRLKSNLTLELGTGACVFASTNIADYAAAEGGRCFVFAEGATNVAIVGKGTIDGRGWAFKERKGLRDDLIEPFVILVVDGIPDFLFLSFDFFFLFHDLFLGLFAKPVWVSFERKVSSDYGGNSCQQRDDCGAHFVPLLLSYCGRMSRSCWQVERKSSVSALLRYFSMSDLSFERFLESFLAAF